MNTITLVMTILLFWGVMGFGFLVKYVDVRRRGGTHIEAWKTYEGLFFVLSVILPLVVLFFRRFG